MGDDVGKAIPALQELEGRMGVRRPLLNKKLFGTWAAVLIGGELVSSLEPTDAPKKELSLVLTTGDQLHTPATLTIRRNGERVTNSNGYGTTDAHLQPGEEIRLTLAGGPPGDPVSETVIGAIEVNERTEVAWPPAGGEAALPGTLQLGCVSLLNEYLLVQRDASGALAEIWLRCDNEPVVLAQADLYSDPTRTGRKGSGSSA